MTPEKFKVIRHLTYVGNTKLSQYLEIDLNLIWDYSQGLAPTPKVAAEKLYTFYGNFQETALEVCDVLSKCTTTELLTFADDQRLRDFEKAYDLKLLANIGSMPIDSDLYRGLIYAVDFLMSTIHENPIDITSYSPHLSGEPRMLRTSDDSIGVVELA